MSEQTIWFDMQTGAIFSALHSNPLDQVDPRYRLYGELLLCDNADFPYKRGDFDTISARGVSRERCIDFGTTAMTAMAQYAGEDAAMTTTVLDRMYIVGQGILQESHFMTGRFKNMRDYSRTVGSPLSRSQRSYFDSWTTWRFVAVAAKIEAETGRIPKPRDYDAYAKKSNGKLPTNAVIRRRFGSYANLNEFNGHPNVTDWEEDKFVDFGATFVEINGIEKLKRESIDIISGRRRGPGYTTIVDTFGSWEKYAAKVSERVELRAETYQSKIHRYKAMIASGEIPFAAMSDDALIRYGAAYTLAKLLLPNTIHSRLLNIVAEYKTRKIITLISESAGKFTAGEIELVAEEEELYDDIWPLRQFYEEHLIVTDDELEELRAKRRQYTAAWRSSRKNSGAA